MTYKPNIADIMSQYTKRQLAAAYLQTNDLIEFAIERGSESDRTEELMQLKYIEYQKRVIRNLSSEIDLMRTKAPAEYAQKKIGKV